jgi:hypothetical protein
MAPKQAGRADASIVIASSTAGDDKTIGVT